MKPALVIMAAGLGSRYGGLKQIDPIGPNGEILLEFAIQDMISFGGEKIICIVSESIQSDFEALIVKKYTATIKIELVIQSTKDTPDIPHSLERIKPWGTGHAVWCAREALDGPFIVINADDFYGRDALRAAYEHLLHHADKDHCIVSYPLQNTLSEYGTVSRGVCTVEQGKLTKILEHTKIARKSDGNIAHTCEDGHEILLSPEAPVSMNLFGFQKHFLGILDRECRHFFEQYGYDEKREFFLPAVVMEMIKNGEDTVEALTTTSEWFGMTYPEDRIEAKEKIKKILPV